MFPMLLALGGSAGLLYSLRSIPTFLFNKIKQRFIFSATLYQYEELFDVVEKWLSEHYSKKYRDVEAKIESETVEMKEKRSQINPSIYYGSKRVTKVISRKIVYKQEVTGYFITFHGKRLFVNKTKEKMEKAGSSLKEAYLFRYTISGFGARKQVDELLKEATEEYFSAIPDNTISSCYHSSYGEWYVGKPIRVKPIDKVIMKDKQKIINDLETWLSSEDWYNDRGIAYKRGYCFYGPPGTGKTTLALAMAHEAGRDVYSLNLNCIDDDSKLAQLFANIPNNAVLLIEDIDKAFAGRDNVSDKSKVSFSGILNCLDGALYKHGLISIVTTNHIEKLDPALLRVGRMDVKVEVKRPEAAEISEFMSVFYSSPVEIFGEFDIAMTEIQEICMKYKDNLYKAKEKIYAKSNNHHVHKAEV